MFATIGFRRIIQIVALFMLAVAPAQLASAATEKSRIGSFTLDNGLQVVVIPDHRAPVVTHMVWYKVGGADEPKGSSGIAHFLEHLMFKSTEKIPVGEFSKIVARLGGQDNAFTGHDATAYFQRVAKDRLPKMMEMEADRMVNLRLTEKEVLTERDVILEERRSRVENNPAAILSEQMDATLYLAHPYGIPIIGWAHEIAKLSREDALNYYKHFYAPNNAIVVIAGDVTVDEVKPMAEATYGKLPANPKVGATRERPQEPPSVSARRVTYKDPRAGKASLHRDYQAPSYSTAEPGEAEALDLLGKVLAHGTTSRVYKKLAVQDKVASSTGGYYDGSGLDGGKLSMYLIAADSSNLQDVEKALDGVIAEVRENGVTEAELTRAKNSYIATYTYENDNQMTLARRYGWALSLGRTIEQVENWPEAIAKVTTEDVKKVAQKYLDPRRSVTGLLIPTPPEQAKIGQPNPPAKPRS